MWAVSAKSRGPFARLGTLGPYLQHFGVATWATVNPETLSGKEPGTAMNLLGGKWVIPDETVDMPDPLNGMALRSYST